MCNHNYFEQLCSASVDGMLTRAEKKELEAHLKDCPACRDYLEDVRELRGLWRELDAPLPTGLHASIMAAVQNASTVPNEHNVPDSSGTLHVIDAPSVEESVKKKDLKEIAVPIGAPLKMYTKKHMRSMVGMLVAAAACVTLVISGGLPDLVGMMVGGGGSAADGAAPAASVAMEEAGMAKTETTADAAVMAEAPMMQEASRMTEDTQEPMPYAAPATGAIYNAAVNESLPVIELPEALLYRAFDGVYLAVGTGKLPVIEKAVLLTIENDRSYYSLPNDISVIEAVIESLPGAGYTVSMAKLHREGAEEQSSFDSGASEVLLVVRTK